MKKPTKKSAPGKPAKTIEPRTKKAGRVELSEEKLSRVSGGVQKVREAAFSSSGGDRPSES
jgi:hypothetical protein